MLTLFAADTEKPAAQKQTSSDKNAEFVILHFKDKKQLVVWVEY